MVDAVCVFHNGNSRVMDDYKKSIQNYSLPATGHVMNITLDLYMRYLTQMQLKKIYLI